MAITANSRIPLMCVGQDSTLRRPKSRGLQPRAFDHSATDATVHSMPYFSACYNIFMVRRQVVRVAVLLAIVFFIAPSIALAASPLPGQIVPEQCNQVGGCQSVCDIATVAQNVLNTGIYIAVFLSAVLFAWAGWLYLTSVAGNERSEEHTSEL